MRKKLTFRRVLKWGLILFFGFIAAVLFGIWRVPRLQPFEWRFYWSKTALEAYAAKVMASDPSTPIPPVPQRVGDFQAGGAERLPHGFLFICDYGGPFDTSGIAYSTEPLPAEMKNHEIIGTEEGHDDFEHVEGNWYTVDRN